MVKTKIINAAHRVLYTFYIPIAVITPLAIPIHLYSLLIILKKESLAFSVKFLMAVIAIHRTLSAVLRSYFAMCYHRKNCWTENNYSFWSDPTLSNILVVCLCQIVNRSMAFMEFGLSINRFFAVFFDGQYYHKVQKTTIPLALISIAFCCLMYIPKIRGEWEHRGNPRDQGVDFWVYRGDYINPNVEMVRGTNHENSLTYHFSNCVEQVVLESSAISIVADTLVFLRLKIVKRHQPTNNQKISAELRLSILAFTTHCVQIIPTITIQPFILSTFRWILSHYVTIYNYHWNTVQGVAHVIMSVVIILLLRPTEDEKKTRKIRKI